MNTLNQGLVIHQNTETQDFSIELEFGKIKILSAPAPIDDRVNQDACGARLFNNMLLLCLADGMGGHKKGEEAAHIVMDELIFNWKPNEVPNLEKVLDRIENAHNQIKDLKSRSGSTAVVAIVEYDKVRFINVGDSTGYIFSSQKNLKFKTIEQSPTGFAVEAGILEEEEAMIHEESHYLLNSLGFDPLRIELSNTLELSSKDLILLASDGLTSNILQEDFAELLTQRADSTPLQSISTKAREKMLKDGHPDDLSLILFYQ
ncbi:MAG: protein serine/threonine phosphatase 2C family protein [Bdellovibrionales bacterium]|nr:protein serine/threonine phosphatase 2C family protein [Bdellovibrionales bacterium]